MTSYRIVPVTALRPGPATVIVALKDRTIRSRVLIAVTEPHGLVKIAFESGDVLAFTPRCVVGIVEPPPPEPEDPPTDAPCPACERRIVERLVDPLAVFRTDVATRLGFEDAGRVSRSEILAALNFRLQRIDDLRSRWSEERSRVEALKHRLDAVRACLLADDVDGAKQLLSEAAPGAEGTHGAGPGAAEETKEVRRG